MKEQEAYKTIVLFDGVCNFCNSSVNFIIKHDTKNYFRFAPLQSEAGKQLLKQFGQDPLKLDSLVLIENNILYKRSTAALRIAKQLNGAYFLLYGFIIIPRFLRDGVYNYIGSNRYKWFGKKDSCMIPTAEMKERFVG